MAALPPLVASVAEDIQLLLILSSSLYLDYTLHRYCLHYTRQDMDVRHYHGSDVHVVRACHNDDGIDLIALGGIHSVQVLQTVCKIEGLLAKLN